MIENFIEQAGSAFGSIVFASIAIPAGLVVLWRRVRPIPDYRRIYVEDFGYTIPKGWQVHHINGNRRDNSRGNLVAVPYQLHRRYHVAEFSFGRVEYLIRNGTRRADFDKAEEDAVDFVVAAFYISECYKNRRNPKGLENIERNWRDTL